MLLFVVDKAVHSMWRLSLGASKLYSDRACSTTTVLWGGGGDEGQRQGMGLRITLLRKTGLLCDLSKTYDFQNFQCTYCP